MHLSDGFLPASWCSAGFVGTALLLMLGLWRLRDEELPRIALVTAAFFVASSIRVPLGISSVHLVLNGLVGAMLGRRAGVSIFLGLLMQWLLVGHGGWSTLGTNTVVMAVPALAFGIPFRQLLRQPVVQRSPMLLATLGGILGAVSLLTSLILQSALLWWSVGEIPAAAALWFGVHLPLAAIEAAILAVIVGFLVKVKPEMLGIEPVVEDQFRETPAKPIVDTASELSPTESVTR
jgi:cobalt/nickel transport system permease protein